MIYVRHKGDHRSLIESRLCGLIIQFISALKAIGVGELVYYFKTKQNKSYQNQLHFRELKDINASINTGYRQTLQVDKQLG